MKLILLLLLIFCGSAFAQGQVEMKREDISVPADLFNALKRAEMIFDMPEGYKAVKVIPNPDMDYVYAVRSPDKKLEVRYVIWPLDSQIAEYNRPRKEGETHVDPNTITKSLTLMHMANISITPLDELQEILAFDSEAVKHEFNADWGATASLFLRKSFGGKYEFCSVVALHKDKVADAWIFFLAKNKDELLAHMDAAFHSLR
ncbi:MAG: hypothetical protein Q8919_15350, partial [Bacteroidota bacterium]|nr:hypothetical protein [Bacteroidota bacterium]